MEEIKITRGGSHPEKERDSYKDRHHSYIISSTENIPQPPQTSRSKEASPSPFSFPRPPPSEACTVSIEDPLAAVDPVVGNAKRPVPISNVAPPPSRLRAFPPLERVTPAAPAVSVVPSTMKMEDDSSSLTSNPSISMSDDGTVGAGVVRSGIVSEAMSRVPDG